MFDLKNRMMTIDHRKQHGYTTIKEDMERKVHKLNLKTQLLQKKVTGVNFYLQDVATLSKVKVPIAPEDQMNSTFNKTATHTFKSTPTKSIKFLTRDNLGGTTTL